MISLFGLGPGWLRHLLYCWDKSQSKMPGSIRIVKRSSAQQPLWLQSVTRAVVVFNAVNLHQLFQQNDQPHQQYKPSKGFFQLFAIDEFGQVDSEYNSED